MTDGTQTTLEPDFVVVAKKDGMAVLARWERMPGWHYAVWKAPDGSEPHWCVEGRWTPGPDPVAFMPMPGDAP